jgi:protein-S-isoprenylcysteine O-methyltransferase Ste14
MVFIGSAILLEAWLGGLIAAVIMIYVYHLRITAEEESLVKAFGKKYQDYRSHTQRLIPYLW